MTPEITLALVAADPPTLAAVLAFLSSRSVKRSVGPTNGISLGVAMQSLDGKFERLSHELGRLAERQARLEERVLWHLIDGAS